MYNKYINIHLNVTTGIMNKTELLKIETLE